MRSHVSDIYGLQKNMKLANFLVNVYAIRTETEMMNKIDVSLKIFIIEPIFRPKNVIFFGSLF